MNDTVLILNGPNLNLLGEREPHIYGYETLADIKGRCVERAKANGLEIDFRQSNFEGDLIESVHEARNKFKAIIINPAGLTYTSISLLDAFKSFEGLKIEVHLANPHRRESYYSESLIAKIADVVISGMGSDGYVLSLEHVRNKLDAMAQVSRK
jgi:3-dehydroquinate dehydratase-2